MKRIVSVSVLAYLGLLLVVAWPVDAQDMQDKVEAAKQAAARNQQALRSYSWIEKTEISVKGEVKNTKIQSCQYGADGKVQKSPVTEPAQKEEEQPQRGRRGRRGGRIKQKAIEKKKGEMQEEMQAAGALVQRYLPPDPEKIQAAKAAGKITVTPGVDTNTVRIADYEKEGDALTLTLDAAGKGMTRIDVDTWMEKPDDKVTLGVEMQSLPDGTSHPDTILLSVPSSHVDVKITNSNYQKLAQ